MKDGWLSNLCLLWMGCHGILSWVKWSYNREGPRRSHVHKLRSFQQFYKDLNHMERIRIIEQKVRSQSCCKHSTFVENGKNIQLISVLLRLYGTMLLVLYIHVSGHSVQPVGVAASWPVNWSLVGKYEKLARSQQWIERPLFLKWSTEAVLQRNAMSAKWAFCAYHCYNNN